MTNIEYNELPDEVKELINKEADARCRFKMDQFMTSLTNQLKFRQNAFTFDPYYHLDTREMKESHDIIVSSYLKERNMNNPFDNAIMETRGKFKKHFEERLDDKLNNLFRGKANSESIPILKKLIFNNIEEAFDVDKQIFK